MKIDFSNNTLIVTLYNPENAYLILIAFQEIENLLCKRINIDEDDFDLVMISFLLHQGTECLGQRIIPGLIQSRQSDLFGFKSSCGTKRRDHRYPFLVARLNLA